MGIYIIYALVAQLEERVTVNHKADRSKLSEGVIFNFIFYCIKLKCNYYI